MKLKFITVDSTPTKTDDCHRRSITRNGANRCRKPTTSGRRHPPPKIHLPLKNSETPPNHVEFDAQTPPSTRRTHHVESRNVRHELSKSQYRANVVSVRSNGEKEDD